MRLPGPVLSNTLSNVTFSDENSLGKEYKLKEILLAPQLKVPQPGTAL